MNRNKDPYASRFWTKNYDKGVPIALEVPEMNVYELVDIAAKKYGKKSAIFFQNRTIDYETLKDYVERLATAFVKLGLKKDQRVGLLMPNVPQFIVAYYGILRAGGIVCPCNTDFYENGLKYQLNDSGAEFLVADTAQLDKINAIKDSTNIRYMIISSAFDFAQKANKNLPEIEGTTQLLNLLDRTKPDPPIFETNAKEDIAVLQYTPGYPELPKGAMLTHHALVAAAKMHEQWANGYMIPGKETILTQLPLWHVVVWTNCLNSIVNIGGCIALYPDLRDNESFVKVFKKSRPMHLLGVPRTYMLLLENEGFLNLSGRFKSVKICKSGAAPLPPESIKEFEHFTNAKIVEFYGMTETASLITSNPVNGVHKIASVGMPLPNMGFKLVDINDPAKTVSIGDIGEIALKSDTLLKGYWNDPKLTAERIKEGWFLTGDIAKMDEEGYVFIVDRKGLPETRKFVYPKNIENVIVKHDAVDKVKVIGVPDAENPENKLIKAILVLKIGYDESDDLKNEIREFCGKYLEPIEIPKLFEFRKDL